MGNQSTVYGTSSALTITLTGLPSSKVGLAQRSLGVVNSDGFQDFEVQVNVACPSTVDEDAVAAVYLCVSADGGANWETGGGTDARITLNSTERCLGHVPMVAGATVSRVFSIAQRGGFVPRDFAICVSQNSGAALPAGSSVSIRGVRTSAA